MSKTMRHPNVLTPTEILATLADELRLSPLYIDGLPPAPGVRDYYTLSYTAGLPGQLETGVVTLIYWAEGIEPRPEAERAMVEAVNALPTTPIVWEPRDVPVTSYLHAEGYTTITQRIKYTYITD